MHASVSHRTRTKGASRVRPGSVSGPDWRILFASIARGQSLETSRCRRCCHVRRRWVRAKPRIWRELVVADTHRPVGISPHSPGSTLDLRANAPSSPRPTHLGSGFDYQQRANAPGSVWARAAKHRAPARGVPQHPGNNLNTSTDPVSRPRPLPIPLLQAPGREEDKGAI